MKWIVQGKENGKWLEQSSQIEQPDIFDMQKYFFKRKYLYTKTFQQLSVYMLHEMLKKTGA